MDQDKRNVDFCPEQVALQYKKLWRGAHVSRDIKSELESRPIFHQRDENIRGHAFYSFPALVLRKEIEQQLDADGHDFEWSDIKQGLKARAAFSIEGNGKPPLVRNFFRSPSD